MQKHHKNFRVWQSNNVKRFWGHLYWRQKPWSVHLGNYQDVSYLYKSQYYSINIQNAILSYFLAYGNLPQWFRTKVCKVTGFLPPKFCDKKCSLSSNLTCGYDVTVAEKHSTIMHCDARTTKFRQKVDRTNWKKRKKQILWGSKYRPFEYWIFWSSVFK